MSGEAHADAEVIELKAATSPDPLAADRLRWRCDPAWLTFDSTAELEPIEGVIGQESAIDALQFGLEVAAAGQNIFVRGLTGTGRLTLIRRMLTQVRLACPMARDRCYVHNFTSPERPRLVTLPRGQAPAFRRAMEELCEFIRVDLPGALRSEAFEAKKTALEQASQREAAALIAPFEQALKDSGLALVTVMVGPVSQAALFPIVEGRPVPPEQWQELRQSGRVSDAEAAEFQKKHDAFQAQLATVMEQVSAARSRHAQSLAQLREQQVRDVLKSYVSRILGRFEDPNVGVFLGEVVDDAVRRLARPREDEEDFTQLYRVNVLISRGGDDGCEIVVETVPTMSNLLGVIERRFDREGVGRTNHMLIRAGSLLRADGGYLILEARDILSEPGAWRVLLRTLKTGRLEIVPPEVTLPWWGPSMQPEPIDVAVKVILLGDAEIYALLDAYDADFPNLFKVLADFDTVIARSKDSAMQYGRVLARIAREEGLPPFERGAVAALVEHGARIAGQGGKLTTRFGRLADIAREAAFVASKNGRTSVSDGHVGEAVRRTKRRAEMPSRRFREAIAEGTIKIAVSGSAVGQINGLAVMQAGPLTYGFPARITATIGPGSAGVINIDREADLSGAIHTKGFYILGGLLRTLLRTHHPLAFNASIAFEQSYGGIDGDSASGAEICCLLSALTDIPLRQDLAMTGAIDQVGNILTIGAANEKIEGFFDACRDLGLTGTQGVIIPASNAPDLMLRPDVVETCRAGKFHVYAVDHVRTALGLLTGIEAGEPDELGLYPDETLLGVAVGRAYEYWIKASQNAPQFAPMPDEAEGVGSAGSTPAAAEPS